MNGNLSRGGIWRGTMDTYACLRQLRISSPYFLGGGTNKCKTIVRIVSKIGAWLDHKWNAHTHTHTYIIIYTHTLRLHYAPLHFITLHSIALIHPWKHIKPPRATNITLSSASQVTLWELNCTSARWLSLAVSENKAICQKKHWQILANVIKYLIVPNPILIHLLCLFLLSIHDRYDPCWHDVDQPSLMEPQNWPVQPKPTKAVPAATALDPLSSEK